MKERTQLFNTSDEWKVGCKRVRTDRKRRLSAYIYQSQTERSIVVAGPSSPWEPIRSFGRRGCDASQIFLEQGSQHKDQSGLMPQKKRFFSSDQKK